MKRKRRIRKSENSQEVSTERWLVSYADFVTLLFAFFTILFATSDVNSEKSQNFQQSIKQYLIKFGAMGESGQKVNDGKKENTPIEPPIQTFKSEDKETEKLRLRLEDELETKLSKKGLNELIVDIYSNKNGVTLSLNGNHLFPAGSFKFKGSVIRSLDEVLKSFIKFNKPLVISGHVGPKEPLSQSIPSEWELASFRATTMARYMIEKFDFNPKTLTTVSFGNQKPIFPDKRSKHFSKNNRVDILIVTDDFKL